MAYISPGAVLKSIHCLARFNKMDITRVGTPGISTSFHVGFWQNFHLKKSMSSPSEIIKKISMSLLKVKVLS